MTAAGNLVMDDGIELVTRRWYADEPKATLLLVHGVSEHGGRWGHVGEFFAARGYNTHVYDLRGHGNSGGVHIDLDSFDQHVHDLVTVADDVRDHDLPFVIYGHSMGGLVVALHAESPHPKPDLYVLSAPALSANVPPPLRIAASLLSRFAPKIRLGAPIKGEQLSRNPDVGEAYFSDPLVRLKGTARFGQAFLDAMEKASMSIDKIATPTLVVHGGDDTIVLPAASAPLARVSTVTRKVFPGLRHEMHNEPEATDVLGFIAGWLDERLPTAGELPD